MPVAAPARPPGAAVTLGSTTPRIWTPPLVAGPPGPCGCGCALTPRTSLGFQCVEFARTILGIKLLPWQRWLLIHAMELRRDGRFRFRTILILVARQNGKTTLIEVKNLFKMFILKVPLIIGTAQILDYAEESWDKAVEIVESIPDLAACIQHVDRTNGKKALRLIHGSRWKIATASRKGGRSLSADDVNLDELREHHTWESWAAVTKTTMARKKAQIWALTNAGDDRSVVLNQLQEKGQSTAEKLIDLLAKMVVAEAEEITRAAAEEGIDLSFGHFEWSAPADCATDDPRMWAMANPSMGYPQGISVEALSSAQQTDPDPVFRTECLCQRVPNVVPPKIPIPAWLSCKDTASHIAGGVVLTWTVAWDRSAAAILAAGYRSDGIPHVEMIDYREGTDWVAARFGGICGRQPVIATVYDPGGPGASLLPEILAELPTNPPYRRVQLDPKSLTMREVAQGCARTYDAARDKQMRHLGDDRLLHMLRNSAWRNLSDMWAWDLKNALTDICGLVGFSNALEGLALYGQPPPPPAPPTMTDDFEAIAEHPLAVAGF
jgi:hypothetical protein